MGKCRYCGKATVFPSTCICKECYKEIFRYEQSVKWFSETEMDKLEYYKVLAEYADSVILKDFFYRESDGLLACVELRPKEKILGVLRNNQFFSEDVHMGISEGGKNAGRRKEDKGYLILTDERILFRGSARQFAREFEEIGRAEVFEEYGISLTLKAQNGEREKREIFLPCRDYCELIKKLVQWRREGISIREKGSEPVCGKTWKVAMRGSVKRAKEKSYG